QKERHVDTDAREPFVNDDSGYRTNVDGEQRAQERKIVDLRRLRVATRADIELTIPRRFETVPPDQEARDRATGETRKYQTHRCAHCADLEGAVASARRGNHGRPRDCGAMAACQRNAAGE